MTTKVKMRVTLEPVGQPWVIVDVNGQGQLQKLLATSSFDFNFRTEDKAVLSVRHFEKNEDDANTAVIVKDISFFGIGDPRFIWAGNYYPEYPEHYPDKVSPRPGQGYLGWNGVYILKFSVPVFTWIHQIQNLGWIYE